MYRILKIKKKAALCIGAAVLVLAMAMGVSAFAAEDDVREIPVIMYHSVLDDYSKVGKYVISPEELEKDMKWIKENGYTPISVKELSDYTKNNGELPEKPIMLTFDDGYYNNYLFAYPLAVKHKMPILISPIGYYSNLYSEGEKPSKYYSHCTWEQIGEMYRSGYVEFGNHTYNLHKSDGPRLGAKQLPGEADSDYREMLTQDIAQMQKKLEAATGKVPECFVYPFGAMTKNTVKIVDEMHFSVTFTCEEKMNRVSRDEKSVINMGRYLRTQDRSVEEILR